jgi:transcription elongation regulator 1
MEKSIKKDEEQSGSDVEEVPEKKESDKDEKSSGKSDSESEKDQEDGEHSGTSDDDEGERKKKERQARAEASIKEREKEVQRTLANHLRDRDKEREHHAKNEAIRHFTALLADLVRNADLSWKEVKKQLKKDHRWELCDNLDRDDRERLFNDHIGLLTKKKRDKFREMLEEIPSLELTSTWKEIKKLVKDDPRYLKFSSSERVSLSPDNLNFNII